MPGRPLGPVKSMDLFWKSKLWRNTSGAHL